MINEPPVAPAPPVNWIVDKILLDQLVGSGEEGFPEQMEQDHPQGQEINMDVQDEEQDGEQPQLQEQNMQMHIGYMFNPTFGPDPAFLEWERSKNEKAAELWASFFSNANPNSLHIKIPSQWAQFFTVLLLSPNNFSWAKDFLSSNATSCLILNDETIDFFLPPKCPSDNALPCPNNTDVSALNNDAGNKQIHQEESLSINLNITPSKKSTSRRDTPVVDSALRRSTRLKEVSNGFKRNSCSSKKCLACSPNPPSIPFHSNHCH